MLKLIRHVIQTSARRDRTEINAALLEAIAELFNPTRVAIHRCYGADQEMIVFTCAGIDADGPFNHNAYLPDRRYCRNVTDDPVLDRCRRSMMPIREELSDQSNRHVFPVRQEEHLLYLIDITLPADFPASELVVLMGIAEYFSNHIGLLDYGETDTLTRLANRKTFDKHLFEVMGHAVDDSLNPPNGPFPHRRRSEEDGRHWLAVGDIDRFKSINDNYGHLIGDEVLVMMAQIMRNSFRFDDQLFRFGGEEFVVVLQPSTRENALKVFDRFRTNVEAHLFSQVGRVTMSVGVTSLQDHDLPTDAIGRADEALYYAKQHGRNQVRLYEDLVETGELAAKVKKEDDIELF